MKKLCNILSLLAIVILMVSCKKEPSLQKYLVESQDKKGFITLDVPSSIFKITLGKETSKNIKETLESIHKVNIVALPYKGYEADYKVEKEKLKSIFSNTSKYKSLFAVKDKRGSVNLYYLGKSEAINEIIAFGYGKEAGVGIARIMGDNMNPKKIMEAMYYIKDNKETLNLSRFKMLFNGIDKNKITIDVDESKE